MTYAEAMNLLRAWESGYVDRSNPDVSTALRITRKNAFESTYASPANPSHILRVRRIDGKTKIRTLKARKKND